MKKFLLFLGFFCCSLSIFAIDFKDAAEQRFQALFNNVDSISDNYSNVFWQLAIAFHSMMDYYTSAKKDPSQVLEKAYQIFQSKTKSKEWWWDDYGWWGIFWNQFGQGNKQYEEASEYCFLSINNAAPYAWDKASSQIQKEQEPLFEGGCFNANLVEAKTHDGLTGIQNTITNALMLDLSLRLFLHSYQKYISAPNIILEEKIKKYWNVARRQESWFSCWFDQGLFNNKLNFVEERVSKYKNNAPALYYKPNRAWVGDQGVMLGALGNLIKSVELINSSGNPLKLNLSSINVKRLKEIKNSLLLSVKKIFIKKDGSFGNLHIDEGDNFPFGDWSDYFNGTGIWFRFFNYSNYTDTEYQKIIEASATASASGDIYVTDINSFLDVQNSLANINAILSPSKRNILKNAYALPEISWESLLCCCFEEYDYSK